MFSADFEKSLTDEERIEALEKDVRRLEKRFDNMCAANADIDKQSALILSIFSVLFSVIAIIANFTIANR